MSKPNSYFDWQSTFRKKIFQINKENLSKITHNNDVNVNSLGISDNAFKDFMRKWKNENF